MSPRVKIPRPPKRIKRDEFYSFSFAYLSEDSQYGTNYFGNKNTRDGFVMYQELMARLRVLSSIPITNILDMNKIQGLEYMPIKYFCHSIQNTCRQLQNNQDACDTQKLIIFRFGKQKYRMICVKAKEISGLLYVIAFDFDYSAYNHG